MSLTPLEKEHVQALADDLLDAFFWHTSPEGTDFWLDVYQKLTAMVNHPKPASAPPVSATPSKKPAVKQMVEIQLETCQAALSELRARLLDAEVI